MTASDRASDETGTSWRAKAFPMLLVFFAALYAWRLSGVLEIEPITNHLSNLYLSGAALTLLTGSKAFQDPGRRTRVLAPATGLLAVNIIGEIVLALVGLDDEVNEVFGNVNTSDPVDGVYGIVGVLLVLSALPRQGHRRIRPGYPL